MCVAGSGDLPQDVESIKSQAAADAAVCDVRQNDNNMNSVAAPHLDKISTDASPAEEESSTEAAPSALPLSSSPAGADIMSVPGHCLRKIISLFFLFAQRSHIKTSLKNVLNF